MQQRSRCPRANARDPRRQPTRPVCPDASARNTSACCPPPSVLSSLLLPCFTKPTLLRFTLLAVACILTIGCRTTANLLRTLGRLAPATFAYRRFLPQPLVALAVGVIWPPGSSTTSSPKAPSSSPPTIRSPNTPATRSTARVATATLSAQSRFTAFRWTQVAVLAVLVAFP